MPDAPELPLPELQLHVLEPLLGDFYRKDEMPFVRAINASPADELALLVYADWLDDHGHADRVALVRRYTRFAFHGEGREALAAALAVAPPGWP